MVKATRTVMHETIVTRDVTEFFNTDYKDWAKSVVEERAIPSVIDGFKPAARKVMHAAVTGSLKDGKLYKLLALSGDAMKLSLYSHGDMSLNGVIVGLCKNFNDNLNPLESDSQVGTLREPDSAGSPRYLYVRHSKYINLIYKTDYNLIDFVFDEGQTVEPEHYLPIIPTVLCKNNIGVAVGYSMRNVAYSPVDVCDACIAYLKNGKAPAVAPYVRCIDNKKSWSIGAEGNWVCSGDIELNATKGVARVTGLPYDMTYDAFEKLLNKLTEQSYIKGWTNMSSGDSIDYIAQFDKASLKKTLARPDGKSEIMSKFKLVRAVPKDMLWLLDENNRLTYFDNIYDVIKYFCNFRLSVYKERKKRSVKQLEDKLSRNQELLRFITAVIKNKLKINNRPLADIKKDMLSMKLAGALLSTPMSRLTAEEVKALETENAGIKEQLNYIKSTSERDMYIADLAALRKELVKDFIR